MSDSDIENAEARLTLEKTLQENERLKEEIAGLNEKLAVSQAAAARSAQSVAIATGEAEVFRRQTGELKLRLEALGLDGAIPGKLEQRLLSAVSDLRTSEEDRKKLRETLLSLGEAVTRFAESGASDASSRKALDAQLAKAYAALGSTPPNAVQGQSSAATLSDAMIIEMRGELALVVANVGSKAGVSVGMPFQVLRGGRTIALVRVVDVREKIAGAVIENLNSEKEQPKVGDRLKVAARQ